MKQLLKWQIFLVFSSLSLFFWGFQVGLSVFCGGLVSLLNGYLSMRYHLAQKTKMTLNAQKSLTLVWKSLFIRFLLVIVLIGFGLWVVFEPEGLIAGFVIGQVGFLLDRFKILKTEYGE